MINERTLLRDNKYKFKHISLQVLEKDENNNILAFSAGVVTTKLGDKALSDGQIEINRTLWNQSSNKRPSGYWALGSPEKEGIMKSIFVADEWFDKPEEAKEKQMKEWGL